MIFTFSSILSLFAGVLGKLLKTEPLGVLLLSLPFEEERSLNPKTATPILTKTAASSAYCNRTWKMGRVSGAIGVPRFSSSCYFTYTSRGNGGLCSRPSSSSHPLIWIAPAASQSSVLRGSVQFGRRFGHHGREGFTSFGCGTLRHLPESRATWSLVLVKNGRLSCYHSSAFPQSQSGSSPSFVNPRRNTPQTYDHRKAPTPSKLEWTRAGDWEKLKKMYYKVPKINGGGVSQQYDDFPSENGGTIHVDAKERINLLGNSCSGFELDSAHPGQCEPFTVGEEHVLEVHKGIDSNSDRSHGCTTEVHRPRNDSFQDTIIPIQCQREFLDIYDEVLVVDNMSTAKSVVEMLTTKYKDLIHACDTEVSKIDVKQDTPVGHGEIICFSIYSGPTADFGNGKSCIWVDLLDGGADIIKTFAPFFEDPSIKKVWHNYSFDYHVIENYGIKASGFHADTMHLARLWDSSRQINGGYSLEALSRDPVVMGKMSSEDANGAAARQTGSIIDHLTTGKISMKDIFSKKKMKKDGTEGKNISIDPVEILQREERIPWICYSALDSISTLKLFECLKHKLVQMDWLFEDEKIGHMYDFYEKYWRPFGNILVEMEAEGILVDRAHLTEIERVAIEEQIIAAEKFKNWAAEYCADAKFMNVGSDAQIRQLFFGGVKNIKNPNLSLPIERTFQMPNNVNEEGKKSSKLRNITLVKIGQEMEIDIYTPSGLPSVSGDALKRFAGKVSASEAYLQDDESQTGNSEDTSVYGTAYAAFGKGKKGRDACLAIAALCEISSIDSLISNFILPLQGNHIYGKDGRIHCSLNINTETGRLSARRPSLQNPPALEKDRYKIRAAFVAAPGNRLIVADYGQLELRILGHLANCKTMLDAFKAGGDFHSRTAMNMYEHIRMAVEEGRVLLEWKSQPGDDKPQVPSVKDAFASERRRAKMLNFSIAYGKTAHGLAKDWKVSLKEAKETLNRWYRGREEVQEWQEAQRVKVLNEHRVCTQLGRARNFPTMASANNAQRGHIQRAAINAPVQGSAADVAMCAMLEIAKNERLKELRWKLLLQIHDEVILEGPSESAEEAKAIVVECMSKPFDGRNILKVDLVVDAKCAQSWYDAK